ncbi:hypothetical protein sos41_14730 [Alphaproteobacteria bacterium SO-S41]|nr:hypothetical protein sos41_14730 [Alphaproteobacteria bacterium SO-S41]
MQVLYLGGIFSQDMKADMTVKNVQLAGQQRTLFGLSAEDTYFSNINDGSYQNLAELAAQILPENAISWDIGANIGVTCLVLAAVRPAGRIAAVEAGNRNFAVLERNISENNVGGVVTPFNVAIGASDGDVRFTDASAYGFISSEGDPTRQVSPATLFKEFGADRLDFVKIDIEGFEFPFLRAGLDLFKTHGTVIYMEFNAWCLLANSKEDPFAFMEWIVENFAYTYLMDRHTSAYRRFSKADVRQVLHEIIVESGTLRDLLICTEPGRIPAPPA